MRLRRGFSVILPAVLVACGAEPVVTPKEQIQVVQGGAAPAPSSTPGSGKCQALQLANIVGQPYSESVASQARTASGAAQLLVVKPGESVGTPNADRLTLELNGNETVVDARCG